jgi:hypothetical protein
LKNQNKKQYPLLDKNVLESGIKHLHYLIESYNTHNAAKLSIHSDYSDFSEFVGWLEEILRNYPCQK